MVWFGDLPPMGRLGSRRPGCCEAFWTERWRDQATIPRQAKMARAQKARADPTTMKTVPSGRVDCCMNGAPLVEGTEGAG